MVSRTLTVALLLSLASVNAQSIPQCQTACQTTALSGTGCSAPTAACACDSPYQQSMLDCLAKPTSSGGCTYDQIINWMNSIQTQCFLSPPILPPCRTICPLQAQEAAGCSSDTDTGCICGQSYSSTATSCIQQACPDQFTDWNNGHLDDCNAYSSTGSSTPSSTQSSPGSQSASNPPSTTTHPSTTSHSTNSTKTATGTATTSGSTTATTSTSGASSCRIQTLGNIGLGIVWSVVIGEVVF